MRECSQRVNFRIVALSLFPWFQVLPDRAQFQVLWPVFTFLFCGDLQETDSCF